MTNQYTDPQNKIIEEVNPNTSEETPKSELNSENQQTVQEIPLSFWKKVACYGTAFVLFMLIFNTILPIISEWLSYVLSKLNLIKGKDFDKWALYKVLGVIYLSYSIVRLIGNIWRTNEKLDIGTAVTSFPNPFYDPTFKKNAADLDRSYRSLIVDYNKNLELLKEAGERQEELIDSLEQLEVRLRILLRHNNNGNRIIRSLNYSYFKDDALPINQGLKLIIEECMTILEKDQSDKSITLFKVEGSQLKIASSVRINFESIDKRVFNKGEGFAGSIWESNKAQIINKIEENDPRFEDSGLPRTKIGSILGYPLSVEEEVVGVLCLQSENEDGFKESDLITVEFYVRWCTLLIIHDKINLKKTAG